MKSITATPMLVFTIIALFSLLGLTWTASTLQLAAVYGCQTSGDSSYVQCSNLDASEINPAVSKTLTVADYNYTDNYDLSIDHSDLTGLTDAFNGHTIEILYLQYDGSIKMPITFLNTLETTCTEMYINYNEIDGIDGSGGPGSLTRFNLAANAATTIVNSAFSSYTKLVTLELYRNNLTSISADLFTGLTKLETLSLNINNIQTIEVDTFSDLTSLKTVNLSTNYLTFLSDGALNGLENVALYLDNNPFICYCNMQWMKDWLKKNNKTNTGAICVYPDGANFSDDNSFC